MACFMQLAGRGFRPCSRRETQSFDCVPMLVHSVLKCQWPLQLDVSLSRERWGTFHDMPLFAKLQHLVAELSIADEIHK